MKKLLSILLMTCLLMAVGCESVGPVSDVFNDAGNDVTAFANNNPQLDAIANNSITTLGLLLWGVGSTLAAFKKNKQVTDANQAIAEIINDPENTATVNSIKSATLRKVVRNAVKSS